MKQQVDPTFSQHLHYFHRQFCFTIIVDILQILKNLPQRSIESVYTSIFVNDAMCSLHEPGQEVNN